MSDTRIIDQTTDATLVDGDYVIVDNQNEGTRKYNLGKGLVFPICIAGALNP